MVIGEKDLPYFEDALPVVMAQAVPDPWSTTNRWLHALHEFWGEKWVPNICLGSRIQLDEENRLRLNNTQMHVMESLEDNDRLLVQGSAGTGKTLLASEVARREAGKGKRVLLLCFTEALAAFLIDCFKGSTVEVGAIRNFASNLLGEKAPGELLGQSSTYWEEVSLRAALDGVPPENERWETVIVDEGQDFSRDDWELAQECIHPEGKFWVFADQEQGFWADRGLEKEMIQVFMKYKLIKP